MADEMNSEMGGEADDRPAVFTSMPLAGARVGMQWRIAFANALFPDMTWGMLPIACAPLVLATYKELRDMAARLVQEAQQQYHLTKDVVLFEEDSKTGMPQTYVMGIATFARTFPVEFSAFYLDMTFLERLVVAYEVDATHTVSECLDYEKLVSRYGEITSRIHRKTATKW